MEGWDLYIFGFVFFALAAGGFSKGVVGIGLPLTAVSFMSFLIGPPVPVALMPIPILLTNFWQAFSGGYLMRSLQRFWPMLICLPLGTVLGVKVLAEADKGLLSFLLGCSILVFALFAQWRLDWRLSPRAEPFARPLVGLIAGFVGGMSSFFGPPLIMFLVSIGLPKDHFVQAIGLSFLVGIISMILALAFYKVLGPLDFIWSAVAAVPAFGGLVVGQWLRRYIPEAIFRRILLMVFLLSGLNLIRQAIM
ncbi:MAG: sulfite exporter TauE/SafE family protein [Desulfobacteraceae bacterium]|jgi:uncharacterized membrane protein YfcA